MLKNHRAIALRNLFRHKGYALINFDVFILAGLLTVGIVLIATGYHTIRAARESGGCAAVCVTRHAIQDEDA